jgi:hypothetical protein
MAESSMVTEPRPDVVDPARVPVRCLDLLATRAGMLVSQRRHKVVQGQVEGLRVHADFDRRPSRRSGRSTDPVRWGRSTLLDSCHHVIEDAQLNLSRDRYIGSRRLMDVGRPAP